MLRNAVSIAAPLFVLALFVVASPAEAKRKYGMAGCGLGSLVISPSGSQTSAGTTNGSFSSQSFGILLGTSNCVPDAEMAVIKEQEEFVVSNFGTLSKEMAQGSGQTLAALAETFGCDREVLPQFAEHLQDNYNDIFAAPGAIAVLDTTKAYVKANPTLSSRCRHVHI